MRPYLTTKPDLGLLVRVSERERVSEIEVDLVGL